MQEGLAKGLSNETSVANLKRHFGRVCARRKMWK